MSRGGQNGSEEFLSDVLGRLPHAVVAFSSDGRCTFVNDAALRIFERTKEELLACSPTTLSSLIDRSSSKVEVRAFQEAMAQHAPLSSAQLVIARRSGALPVRLDITPLKDGGLVITAAELPEAPSREEIYERTVREFLEHTPDPAVVHRAGMVLYVNPAALRTLGYTLEEMRGRSVLEFVHPDDRAAVVARVQAMVQRGEAAPFLEERFLRRDGSIMHVIVAALPMPYGGEQAIVALGRDITDLKRAEAEREELIRTAQQRAAELQVVLDNMVDGVILCDAQLKVLLANEAMRRLLGVEETHDFDVVEVLTRHPIRRPDRTPLGLEEMPLVRASRGEFVLYEDLVIQSPTGEREIWIRVSAAPVRDDAGRVVAAVAVARDVTDLIELDRLKDQFIRVAAHELKTPVTIVKGYVLTLLRSGAEVPAALRRTLDAIARGAERIDRIVSDLVDISQVDLQRLGLVRQPVDLAELVEAAVDRVSLATRTHRIRLVSTAPVVAYADRDRLEQVLTNLLTNAVRYSPEGGDVEVALTKVGETAEVSVRDRGVGIPREKQTRIFERFYRAHTDTAYDYGGLGVGLYIARAIIAAHGGRMWFESEEDLGSTFFFTLPLGTGGGP